LVYRREPGRFNGEIFWLFLQQLQEVSAQPRRVGPYYRQCSIPSVPPSPCLASATAALVCSGFLPPYSPELNPIERVWKLTRRLCLHNRYFGFLESVVEAVEQQFADWREPNDSLRLLCLLTRALMTADFSPW
jgi:hypothetical protein